MNINKMRDKLIEDHLKTPFKVGEPVQVKGLGIRNNKQWGDVTNILEIVEGGIMIKPRYSNSKREFIEEGNFKKYTNHIGHDPMAKKPWNSSLKNVNFTLGSILYGIGFERNRSLKTYKDNKLWQELNWNPTIKNSEGEDVCYQRDFCWTLEQKQLLIESIYNYINIGMIIIKKNSYESVEKKTKQGKVGYFKDVVDGKQRLNAILGFVNNEFPDLEGRFWKDFSRYGQNRFLDFSSLSYGEIGETATDQDVKDVFLGVNFTGVPISKEHIEFVNNIKVWHKQV